MPAPLTPAERSLRARKAALDRWAHTDAAAASEDARQRIEKRFVDEVDPGRRLDPAERHRRAERAKKAYFAGLALRSAKARRERRGGGGDAAA